MSTAVGAGLFCDWGDDWCRRMLESSPFAILIADEGGRIRWANDQAVRLFGYSRESLAGLPVERLLPVRLRRRHREHRAGYVLDPRSRPMEQAMQLSGRARDGREFPAEVSLNPFQTPDGLFVAASVQDISLRRQAEAELTRLHEEQRRVATALQRSLVGAPSPPSGMTLAGRYLPGNRNTEIGGDWYDVIPLGAGRTALVVGDVMGKGLEAAAVMGQLRSAARALAKTGMPPRRMMQFLDTMVSELPEHLATCCCVLVEPQGEVTVCSAGHPPVLTVSPDGTVSELAAPEGVPLGVGGVPYQQNHLALRPGTLLALYTDGLVESRDGHLDRRIDALAAELGAAVAAAGPLDDVADRVMERMVAPEGPDDEVTLVLVRVPPPPLATASTILSTGHQAVPAGRRFLSSTLDLWGCGVVDDTARLLVSELLSNAVRHGKGPLTLRMRRTPADLVVEVHDHSLRLPQPRLAGPDDESGRGLRLVDALAGGWGTTPTDDGKTVWFTLSLGGQ
jgi:PAS domain S-box-containing protein